MNMKRISLKLLLLVSVLMTFAQCKPAQEELNVVSFNIRMGVAKDGENSWEYRKAASADMVKTLAPDIMGVQEAFDFQTEYIKEQCPDYDGVGVGRDDGKTSGEIMMIFYNTKKVELENGAHSGCQKPLTCLLSDGMQPADAQRHGHCSKCVNPGKSSIT